MGRDFCAAYTKLADDLVAQLWTAATAGRGRVAGLALVAVGGYGRKELCPTSDLDMVLLHGGRSDRQVADAVAEQLWYPLWDLGLKLGHAVRTVREAVALAESHLETATSMLDVRPLAGGALTTELRQRAALQWRRHQPRWLNELHRSVLDRHARSDEVAFLLEPDLKEGRGGLRDVHALQWAGITGTENTSGPGAAADRSALTRLERQSLAEAAGVLLDARVELQRRTTKASSRLLLQEQDAVAHALGDADADVLMARVAQAGRTVAWISDEAWSRMTPATLEDAGKRPDRHPPGAGLLWRNGMVELAADADVPGDPGLALRAAAAAAEAGSRIGRECLERLGADAPDLGQPWPAEALRSFVRLLDAGRPAVAVMEALDQKGILVRQIPEWVAVRSRPQRNAYHRFTVDRHLCETAAHASERVVRVRRPDLLLVGALLHDIGKGFVPALGADHTEAGIVVVERLGQRMGFPPDDIATLVAMVRHHLLLADVATRRDLTDPATVTAVADAVGDPDLLALLHMLTEADSIATGPTAWSPWKSGLIDQLVTRVATNLAGGRPEDADEDFPTTDHLTLVGATEAGQITVRAGDGSLVVVAADRPGLFCRVAGVLTLHSLEVLAARAWSSPDGVAVEDFTVTPMFSGEPSWSRVEDDLRRAVAGRLSLESRVSERARQYGRNRGGGAATAHPSRTVIEIDNLASATATVVEVRTPDGIGVLYRITRALGSLDLDIRSAQVSTLGHEVVDTFYVVDSCGGQITDSAFAQEIRAEVLAELARA